MRGVTRRKTLALIGGGALVAASAGVGIIGYTSQAGLVRLVLEKYLGPVHITERDLTQFMDEFLGEKPWLMPTRKLAKGYEIALRTGTGDIALGALLQEDQGRIELFERRLLGAFHQKTDIGLRQSADEAISYLETATCANPFAVLT